MRKIQKKAIERLKQGESINVQDLETNLYWEFRKFTSRDGDSLESYYLRGTRYDNQRIVNVPGARETVDTTVVQKSGIQCYNCKEYGHVAKECQKPKWIKNAAYHKEKMLFKLEAHYMYMAQIQEITPNDADNSGPIFDTEPLQKVSNNDNYNVFAIESKHPEQSKSVNDIYPIEQDEHNMIIDSLDMSYIREQIDQDHDDHLANERDLLASLIEKLKYEIDDSKNPPESDGVNRLEKESRSKLSDLIRPLDYDKLNNLYDLFVRQREKSSPHRYFSERINADLEKFHLCLKEEMIADLRYFNYLEVSSLKSQLKTQKTQFLNEIDRLSREYYYVDHMNAILGVYTELDEVTNLQIILFIVDSGCSKHMTGILKHLTNFVEKFLCTVKFRNDQIAPILGYGDLVQGTVTIKRVYYVEGLNHNLFSVGQFCDADLEVAFRKSTCYIRDLKGNDLLTYSRGTDLYSITLQDTSSPNPICLMAKATSSQAWLWNRLLFHLNFNTINLLSKNYIVIGLPKLKFIKDHLCYSCELGKAKRKSFQTKTTSSSKDGYNFYTWTFVVPCGSKDETPKVLIDFLRLVQRGLHAQSRAYRVFNKSKRVIVETIHVNFDELPQMASDHVSSDPVPQCPMTVLEHDSLSPGPQSQENVPQAAGTVTMSNELDLLFSLMFDELLNGSTQVGSKPSAVTTADAPNKC
nr:integrase, catalytic region, zinc finger, CCHC-type, peptidase aspartic, catalytic [Tanacetum cinerariifolium]